MGPLAPGPPMRTGSLLSLSGRVAAGSLDMVVYIWDMNTDALIDLFASRYTRGIAGARRHGYS